MTLDAQGFLATFEDHQTTYDPISLFPTCDASVSGDMSPKKKNVLLQPGEVMEEQNQHHFNLKLRDFSCPSAIFVVTIKLNYQRAIAVRLEKKSLGV